MTNILKKQSKLAIKTDFILSFEIVIIARLERQWKNNTN